MGLQEQISPSSQLGLLLCLRFFISYKGFSASLDLPGAKWA